MIDWFEQAITYGVEQGWIDRPGSRNRLNGLEKVHKAMPKEMQAALPPLIIFSPSLSSGGLVLRRNLPTGFAFMYLAPTLEWEFVINATWAVAHEFAHLVLGHGHYRQRSEAEVATDEKAASDLADSWVPKRNPENSRFERVLRKGDEALKLELETIQNLSEDWRTAAFLLLDKRFAEHPHLHATVTPGGDYDVRCGKCGEVENYSGVGDKEVDALTFALYVTGKHTHTQH